MSIQICMGGYGPPTTTHSRALAKWAFDQSITLQFIQKGKPTRNAYIECFNCTYRHGVLDCHVFNSLAEVRALTNDWLWLLRC